jgi:hypothetical protein
LGLGISVVFGVIAVLPQWEQKQMQCNHLTRPKANAKVAIMAKLSQRETEILEAADGSIPSANIWEDFLTRIDLLVGGLLIRAGVTRQDIPRETHDQFYSAARGLCDAIRTSAPHSGVKQ